MVNFSQLMAVSEKTTDIVTWVSLGAIAVLIVALVLICIFNKKYSTLEIAYAGVCLAASFALSFIKSRLNAKVIINFDCPLLSGVNYNKL